MNPGTVRFATGVNAFSVVSCGRVDVCILIRILVSFSLLLDFGSIHEATEFWLSADKIWMCICSCITIALHALETVEIHYEYGEKNELLSNVQCKL